MEVFFIIGIVVVILGIVGAFAYYNHLAAKKRAEEMEQAATDMGLTYLDNGSHLLKSRFAGFKLFGQGHSKKILNMVTGDAGDVAIAIFDYRYTVGYGKHQQNHYQTIVSLASPNFSAPDLQIRPKGFFDRIGSALGFQDINFDSHPEFSNMFVLKGTNEPGIRAFLHERMLSLLESKKGYCLEADGDTMFFYMPNVKSKPDEIKDLLAEAYEVYNCVLGLDNAPQ